MTPPASRWRDDHSVVAELPAVLIHDVVDRVLVVAPGQPPRAVEVRRRVVEVDGQQAQAHDHLFPFFTAGSRPLHTQRRTVSGVRPASWAASRTSTISTPSMTIM
jgi:hypothetical protein